MSRTEARTECRPGTLVGAVPAHLLESPITGLRRFIKRAFDLIVSVVLGALLTPLFLAIALAVRLDSPGPVVIRQDRVGEKARIFRMYKFRSMVRNAEDLLDDLVLVDEDGQVAHKHRDDPRVTKVGRWLRKTSLDELPQLLNVVKGEMSLVGPRPEMPWIVQRYEDWQYRRFAVPQGMTGWWQVSGRSDRPMHMHTRDDLDYIDNYSIWLDLVLLARTVGEIFKARGAF